MAVKGLSRPKHGGVYRLLAAGAVSFQSVMDKYLLMPKEGQNDLELHMCSLTQQIAFAAAILLKLGFTAAKMGVSFSARKLILWLQCSFLFQQTMKYRGWVGFYQCH